MPPRPKKDGKEPKQPKADQNRERSDEELKLSPTFHRNFYHEVMRETIDNSEKQMIDKSFRESGSHDDFSLQLFEIDWFLEKYEDIFNKVKIASRLPPPRREEPIVKQESPMPVSKIEPEPMDQFGRNPALAGNKFDQPYYQQYTQPMGQIYTGMKPYPTNMDQYGYNREQAYPQQPQGHPHNPQMGVQMSQSQPLIPTHMSPQMTQQMPHQIQQQMPQHVQPHMPQHMSSQMSAHLQPHMQQMPTPNPSQIQQLPPQPHTQMQPQPQPQSQIQLQPPTPTLTQSQSQSQIQQHQQQHQQSQPPVNTASSRIVTEKEEKLVGKDQPPTLEFETNSQLRQRLNNIVPLNHAQLLQAMNSKVNKKATDSFFTSLHLSVTDYVRNLLDELRIVCEMDNDAADMKNFMKAVGPNGPDQDGEIKNVLLPAGDGTGDLKAPKPYQYLVKFSSIQEDQKQIEKIDDKEQKELEDRYTLSKDDDEDKVTKKVKKDVTEEDEIIKFLFKTKKDKNQDNDVMNKRIQETNLTWGNLTSRTTVQPKAMHLNDSIANREQSGKGRKANASQKRVTMKHLIYYLETSTLYKRHTTTAQSIFEVNFKLDIEF